MAKKAKKKSRADFIWWFIFISIGAITAASIYFLKNPEVLKTVSPQKENLSSPSMKDKNFSINLYFSDPDSDFLIPEPRRVVFKESDVRDQMRVILEELIQGPKSNLLQTIPSGVVIRDIELKGNGLGIINFSEELARNHPGGSLAEIQTIYSIVNSLLLNIPALKEVQILVEGEAPETLKGHIDLRSPFEPNLSIVKLG